MKRRWNTWWKVLSFCMLAGSNAQLQAQTPAPVLIPNVVTSIAGNPQATTSFGYTGDGVPSLGSELYNPGNVAVDPAGNVYFADPGSNVIREINAQTGLIATVAGKSPTYGCSGSSGSQTSSCYVSGYGGDGGPATSALLALNNGSTSGLVGLAVDALGNLYFIDQNGLYLRVVYKTGTQLASMIATLDPSGVKNSGGTVVPGYIYTIAGSGSAGSPSMAPQVPAAVGLSATGIGLDSSGNIYLIDSYPDVRVINMTANPITVLGVSIPSAMILTVAGSCTSAACTSSATIGGINNTPSTSPLAGKPRGIFVDASGNIYITSVNGPQGVEMIYAGGSNNVATNLIQKLNPMLTPTANTQYTLYGVLTGATATSFNQPSNTYTPGWATDVTVDGAGNVYVADYSKLDLARIDAVTGSVTNIAGLGKAFTATSAAPAYCSGTSGLQTTDVVGDGCTQGQVVAAPEAVALDAWGNVYFADRTYNLVRKVSLGTQFPSLAVGTAANRQTVRIKFYSTNLPAAANAFQIAGSSTEFALVGAPTAATACTTNAGDSTSDCLVTISFTPAGPGVRQAQLLVTDAGGFAHAYGLTGFGTAAAVAIASANGTLLGSGFSLPSAVAVDARGNAFVADTGNNQIVEVPNGNGAPVTVIGTSTAINGLAISGPKGVAVDSAGNLYISDTGNNRVLEFPAGSSQALTVPTPSLNAPQGLAVDSVGNLYIADTGNARVLEIPAPSTIGNFGSVAIGTGSVSLSNPVGVTVDGAGNLYIADSGLNEVVEVPFSDIAGVELGNSGVVTTLGTGFTALNGVAVDAAGTVYAVDGAQGQITAIAPGGGSQNVLPLMGLSSPSWISLDPAGNFYVASTGNNTIVLLNRNLVTLTFPSQLAGTQSSGSQLLRVADSGNLALTLSNLSISGNFVQVASGFNDCGSTTQLSSASFCDVSIAFAPAPGSTGPQSGSLVLTDNALSQASATQTVALTGTAACTCTAQSISFSPPSPVTYGISPITLGAVASSGLTVVYTVTGPASIAGNVLTVTGAGNVVVTASQAGNSVYSPAVSVVQNLTVNPATLTVTATSYTRGTGIANPDPLGFSFSGFVNNETSSVVTGTPVLATTATPSSASGTSYPITITKGTLSAANYQFVLVPGILTVQGAGQTITFAALPGVTYGSGPVALSASSTSSLPVSFAIVSGPGAISGNAVNILGAGTISIQATQAGNYSGGTGYGAADPVTLNLVVAPAQLTFTIPNATRPYGASNPTFTGTFTGILNNDAVSAVYSSSATATSAPGVYPIVPTLQGPKAGNYVASPNGVLTVTAASTVTTLTSSSLQFVGSSPITLTATVSSSTTGIPTGTVTFIVNGVAQTPTVINASGVATLLIKSLSATTSVFSATYSSGSANFLGSASSSLVITKPYYATMTFTVSTQNANQGQFVVFTAQVTQDAKNNTVPPPAGIVPTGTVTFFATTTPLGTATLSANGTATLSSNLLPVGTDSIQAKYNGDANFQPFPYVPSPSVLINVVAPNYTFQLNPYGVFVVKKGQSVSNQLNILPVGGFHNTVNFACSGLPAGAACSFSPSSVTPDGSNNTFTTLMTVSTGAIARNAVPPLGSRTPASGIFAAMLVGVGCLLSGTRRVRRMSLRQLLGKGVLLLLAVGCIGGISGCATGSSFPSGQTATVVTVTATSGTNVKQVTFILTIQ